eukprot:6479391-Amphidinium_carterae.1
MMEERRSRPQPLSLSLIPLIPPFDKQNKKASCVCSAAFKSLRPDDLQRRKMIKHHSELVLQEQSEHLESSTQEVISNQQLFRTRMHNSKHVCVCEGVPICTRPGPSQARSQFICPRHSPQAVHARPGSEHISLAPLKTYIIPPVLDKLESIESINTDHPMKATPRSNYFARPDICGGHGKTTVQSVVRDAISVVQDAMVIACKHTHYQ